MLVLKVIKFIFISLLKERNNGIYIFLLPIVKLSSRNCEEIDTKFYIDLWVKNKI